MKGKIVLLPLKESKEGMKVVYQNTTWIISEDYGLGYIGLEGRDDYIEKSALQQIAVEYEFFDRRDYEENQGSGAFAKKTLPLHPDDYEKALPLIGKEVEFEDVPICENCGGEYCDNGSCNGFIDWHIAKLITPTPIMYTEEDMEKAFSAGWNAVNNEQPRKFRFNNTVKQTDWDAWWNENKKK